MDGMITLNSDVWKVMLVIT